MSKKRRMTAEEARAWKARWKLVHDFEVEELRRTSPAVKFRQFTALLEWSLRVGRGQRSEKAEREVGEVRERWQRLRKALRV